MFKSLTVDRFRGFRQLEIDGMDRFNLFLGMNNVGKTSLLESLFLLAGPTNPNLTLTVGAFRGLEQLRADPEELWGWLFFDKKMTSSITIEAASFNHKKRKLTITLEEQKEIRLRPKSKVKSRRSISTATTSSGPGELVMSYEDENNVKVRTRASLKEGGISVSQDKKVKLPMSVFVSARGGYAAENAERYSKLEEEGKEKTILPALQILEPRLTRLAVLYSGAGPMIYGEIGIGRMIPLPLMGEGLGRVLTLLLSVAVATDGVVLVDEIETGFHYSIMERVWTAIAHMSRENNAQIFATTHSWECFRAAHHAFCNDAPYEFRLHRLFREDGMVHSKTYDRDKIEIAIESGMELR